MSCSLFNASTTFCQADGSNNNVVKIKHGRLNFQSHLSKAGSGFLKWGSLRYFWLQQMLSAWPHLEEAAGIKVKASRWYWLNLFYPPQRSPTKENQYQWKCVLYWEYFHRFTSPPDSPYPQERSWSRYIHLWSLQSRQTPFTKTVILLGRAQDLLVHHCFDQLVHSCCYVNHHQSPTFTREN